MPVAYDASTTHTLSNGTGTSFVHTPVGTPTGVVVHIHVDNTTVTGVTYGGVSMTQIAASDSGPTPPLTVGASQVSAWKLHSPLSGAQTVAISTAGAGDRYIAFATTVIGSDTTSALVVYVGADNTAAQAVSAPATAASGQLGVGASFTHNVQGGVMTDNDAADQRQATASGAAYGVLSTRSGSFSTMAYTSDFSTLAKGTIAVVFQEPAAATSKSGIYFF